MSLAKDMQTYLAAQSIIDDGTWASVRHMRHNDQDRIVVFTADGGGAPEIGTSTGLGSEAFKDPAVQVYVRGRPNRGDDSEDKAQAIYDELHGQRGLTMNGTRYDRIQAQTSGPIQVGFDEKNRPQHTISFRCATSQAAPA